ncbi:copper resistance CopC family protein [Subtercola lobariae]|uniref:CopC domain-containing protein n=1 Tax=Subtercola lobariae TaxID=1588641 RepID=A0A917EWZ0_9MICO|nr:copper resistance CopC family protein [Subtercola lobariae]GGF26998.1 hypothetical protein GCM10011399_20420 [Subtercola lobariae]
MRISPHDAPRLVGFGLLAGLVLAGVGAAVAAAPALAHDTVVSSSPYNGEVVTKPIDTVTVSFSDALMALGAGSATAGTAGSPSTSASSPAGFAIQVTDADGGHHESGCVTVDGSGATTSVALGEAGEYDVTWRVVSDDGHPISGTYSFTWQPTAVTVAAPAYDGAPACGAVWSGAAASGGAGTATGSPGEATAGQTNQTGESGSATQLGESGQVGQTGQAGSSEASTTPPEPTMTILSAVPADSNEDQGLALPIAIVAGVGALAALAVVVVTVFRRSRTGR